MKQPVYLSFLSYEKDQPKNTIKIWYAKDMNSLVINCGLQAMIKSVYNYVYPPHAMVYE